MHLGLRGALVAAFLTITLGLLAGSARAQSGLLPAAPSPISVGAAHDGDTAPLPAPRAVTDTPPATGPAGCVSCALPTIAPVRYRYPVPPLDALPPACAPFEDCNGKLLRGDPLVDRCDYPQPGWFTAFDLTLVAPHIKNRLTDTLGPIPIPAGILPGLTVPTTVHLPTAGLDWVGVPALTVGYRPGEAVGEFLVTYRSLVTDGSAILPGFDRGAGILKSRLSQYTCDLDYGTWESSLEPGLEMKWRIGVRLADVFFDSRATGVFLEQRTSNFFFGAGPHAGLELRSHCLQWAGIAPFARLDSSLVLGRIGQSFEETVGFGPARFAGAADVLHKSQAVPVVRGQVGLGYTPPGSEDRLRFAVAYDYEQWWYLGRLGDSRGELSGQGILFRAEVNY